jgi:hypothetical protein
MVKGMGGETLIAPHILYHIPNYGWYMHNPNLARIDSLPIMWLVNIYE